MLRVHLNIVRVHEKVNCYVACAKKTKIDAKNRVLYLFCTCHRNYHFSMKL
jgi:hypothetical protein